MYLGFCGVAERSCSYLADDVFFTEQRVIRCTYCSPEAEASRDTDWNDIQEHTILS